MRLDGFSRAEITRALREFCGLTQKSSINCYLSVVPKRPWPIKSGWRRLSDSLMDEVLDWDDVDQEVLEDLMTLPEQTRSLSDMLYSQRGPLFRVLLSSSESALAYRVCRKIRKGKVSSFTDLKTLDLSSAKKARTAAIRILERYATARTQESRGTGWASKRGG